MSAAGNGLQGIDDLRNGDYASAAGHFLDAALDLFDMTRSCFAAGTPVITAEGPVPIERIRVGDLVLSAPEHDPDAPPEFRRVEVVFENYSPLLELRVGVVSIKTTAEHPFWVVGRGWLPANQLVEGDRFRTHDDRTVVLSGVRSLPDSAPVYNMSVESYHTYFIGGPAWGFSVWAHNAGAAYGNIKHGGDAPSARPAKQQQFGFMDDAASTSRAKPHGNRVGDQPATLYERYDADGNFLKHGISQDPASRYTQKELNGGYLIETQTGPRKEIVKIERDLVERNPGPLNNEPWAGIRKGK